MTKFNPNFEEDFTLLLNELDLEDEKKNKITTNTHTLIKIKITPQTLYELLNKEIKINLK